MSQCLYAALLSSRYLGPESTQRRESVVGYVLTFSYCTSEKNTHCHVRSCQEFVNKMVFFFPSISINIDMRSLITVRRLSVLTAGDWSPGVLEALD